MFVLLVHHSLDVVVFSSVCFRFASAKIQLFSIIPTHSSKKIRRESKKKRRAFVTLRLVIQSLNPVLHLYYYILQSRDSPTGTTDRGSWSEQDTVRTLFLDDALHKLGRHGLEIHGVSDILRGLHRRNIGVNQHRMNTLLLQRLQCLCTAIVELTGLSNLQGTRA